MGLDALIPIGGEDTLSFAERLSREGFPAVAIPKTMDNDVLGTDYCIGFSTTITRSVEMITNFRTSLGSHERIGIIELFGRHSGGTSLYAAFLAAVDRAIIPEVPFDMERLAGFLAADREANPSHYSMVTVSEGAVPRGRRHDRDRRSRRLRPPQAGRHRPVVSQEIKRLTGTNVMFQQLGYVIRSGAPDTLDRMVATSYGILAADEVARGRSGRLVALQGGSYTSIQLATVAGGQRKIDVDAFYDCAEYRPKVRAIEGQPMFLPRSGDAATTAAAG